MNLVISQPLGNPCPNVEREVTGSREVVRERKKKGKLIPPHEPSSQHELASNVIGSSNKAAVVNPVISQPSGDPCPKAKRAITGSREAVRRGKRQSSFLSVKPFPNTNWPVKL